VTREYGFTRGPVWLQAFQGDDAVLPCSNWGDAAEVVEAYRSILPVNPSKFFIRRTETEYLRLVLSHNGRVGYYARAAAGVMFANAWAGGKMDPASLVATWSLLHGRGASASKTLSCAVSDLCGMLRCTRDDAASLICTPVAVGGLGYCSATSLLTSMGYKVRLGVALAHGLTANVGERSKSATSFTDLNRRARSRILEVMEPRLPRDTALNTVGAVEGLVAGVEPKHCSKKPEQEMRITGAWCVRYDPTRSILTGRSIRSPRATVDSAFLPGLLRDAIKRGLDGVLPLFSSADTSLLMWTWKQMSRNVWIDWALGRVGVPIGKRWGDAPDVLGWLSRRVTRSTGPFPSSYVTRERLKARQCELEIASSYMEGDVRRRYRG